MALKDRIATGTKAVSDIFGAGGAADNVYQDLDYMARQRYAMDANQLNKQKQLAETRATQNFARKRTHGGSAHAQGLKDIANKDMQDRESAANNALAGMRQQRSAYQNLAPELYKLAAAGKIGNEGPDGLRSGRTSFGGGLSAFAGGYTPDATSRKSNPLSINARNRTDMPGNNYKSEHSTIKYIL